MPVRSFYWIKLGQNRKNYKLRIIEKRKSSNQDLRAWSSCSHDHFLQLAKSWCLVLLKRDVNVRLYSKNTSKLWISRAKAFTSPLLSKWASLTKSLLQFFIASNTLLYWHCTQQHCFLHSEWRSGRSIHQLWLLRQVEKSRLHNKNRCLRHCF